MTTYRPPVFPRVDWETAVAESGLTSGQKLAVLLIGSAVGWAKGKSNHGLTWFSQGAIAKGSGLDRKTVNRAVQAAKKAGLLVDLGCVCGNEGRCKHARVLGVSLPGGRTAWPRKWGSGGTPSGTLGVHPSGTPEVHKQVNTEQVNTEQVVEGQPEPLAAPPSAPPQPSMGSTSENLKDGKAVDGKPVEGRGRKEARRRAISPGFPDSRPCKRPGCEQWGRAKGLCDEHYQEYQRTQCNWRDEHEIGGGCTNPGRPYGPARRVEDGYVPDFCDEHIAWLEGRGPKPDKRPVSTAPDRSMSALARTEGDRDHMDGSTQPDEWPEGAIKCFNCKEPTQAYPCDVCGQDPERGKGLEGASVLSAADLRALAMTGKA